MKRVRELVKEADLFSIPITLTYRAEREFKSITSGLVSLALLVFFSYVFISQLVALFNRSVVRSKTQQFRQLEPAPISLNETNFMFAFMINGMDLTTNPRYFDIKVQQCTYRQGVVGCAPVTMEKCTRAHWAKLGNLTENFFELYRMSESLCPSLGFNVDLQGRFSFPEFKDLEITFQQCVGVAGVDCRTALQTSSFLAAQRYQFMLSIFYLDTLVDPDNENPYSYYINDDFYWGFSPQQGMQVMMNVRTQTINTDNALLPFEDVHTIVSPIIEPAITGSYSIVNLTQQNYVTVYMVLSSTGVRVTRSFYKFDELLAYLGGLFALIALLVEMPLRAYNQMCQDVGLSHYLYNYEIPEKIQEPNHTDQQLMGRHRTTESINMERSESRKVAPTDAAEQHNPQKDQPHSFNRFNFLLFIAVGIYKLVRTCYSRQKLKQNSLDAYADSLEEIHKELDVRRLIQRFLILERAVKCLMPTNLYPLLAYFRRENIYHLNKLNSSLKHCKHILNGRIDESDEQQRKELRSLIDAVRNNSDELSRRVLTELDPEALKLCAQTLPTLIEESRQDFIQALNETVHPAINKESTSHSPFVYLS